MIGVLNLAQMDKLASDLRVFGYTVELDCSAQGEYPPWSAIRVGAMWINDDGGITHDDLWISVVQDADDIRALAKIVDLWPKGDAS